MDWDQNPVYHANLGMQGSGDNGLGQESTDVSPNQAKSRLREFIRNYRERDIFVYRDQLLQRYRKGDNYLDVDLAHLNAYDPVLQDMIQKRPNAHLPLFEEAAKDALAQLIVEKEDDFVMPDIHIMLKSDQTALGMRQITASEVNRLIKVLIIISR
jgi:DNA replication licensing factor MCM5